MNYLEQAIEKRKSSKKVDYTLPIINFICWCYVYLTPASYGAQLQKYFCHILLKLQELDKSLAIGDFSIGNTSGEFKATYLSKDNEYNFTHLRQWHGYDYYLLCLIDCDDNFTPEFLFVNKVDLDNFNLEYMNGTKKENEGKENRERRLTIRKGSKKHKQLRGYNLMCGTTYEDLKTYIDKFTIS